MAAIDMYKERVKRLDSLYEEVEALSDKLIETCLINISGMQLQDLEACIEQLGHMERQYRTKAIELYESFMKLQCVEAGNKSLNDYLSVITACRSRCGYLLDTQEALEDSNWSDPGLSVVSARVDTPSPEYFPVDAGMGLPTVGAPFDSPSLSQASQERCPPGLAFLDATSPNPVKLPPPILASVQPPSPTIDPICHSQVQSYATSIPPAPTSVNPTTPSLSEGIGTFVVEHTINAVLVPGGTHTFSTAQEHPTDIAMAVGGPPTKSSTDRGPETTEAGGVSSSGKFFEWSTAGEPHTECCIVCRRLPIEMALSSPLELGGWPPTETSEKSSPYVKV